MKKLIFLLVLSVLMISAVWGQGAEDFTNMPANNASYLARTWTGTNGVTWNAAGARTDQTLTGRAICWGNSGTRNVISPSYTGGMGTLTFNYVRAFTSTSARSLEVYVNSTMIGSTITVSPTSDIVAQYSTVINVSGNVVLEIRSTGAAQVKVDDISWTGYTASTPSVSVNPTSLTGFTYHDGSGPSGAQSFDVAGLNLTGNLSVSSTGTDYVISSTLDGTYGTSLNLTPSGGAVSATVYVKLKSGLAIGEYNSQNITVSGGGATAKTVTCSGEVTTPPPPPAPTATDATSTSENSFTANWNTVSGATGYYLDVYTKTTGSNASDLFISEYLEGSGTGNKYIEIYNGTGASVDLSNYTLRLYSNGSATVSQSVVLSGTLLNGNTYVIGRTDGTIYTSSNLTNNFVINFNGDDAIELYRTDTTTTVDIFGMIGQDPGTQWTATGGYTTLDKTLVRKSTIAQGVSVNPSGYLANDPSAFETLGTEWDVYDQDTASYLGSHTFSGGSSKTFVNGYENRNVSSVLTYEVTGLNPETTYYYVVRAYDSYSQSSVNSNEISVTASAATTYDIPEDEVTTVGASDVWIIGGPANIVPEGVIPPISNGSFTASQSMVLNLIGAGPWDIVIETAAIWGAYHRSGAWTVAENEAGLITFEGITAAKDMNLPIILGDQNPTLPIELSSFTYTINANNLVTLQWVTETETGVSGYYIFRSKTEALANAALVSNMIPASNTSTTQSYVFVDSDLQEEGIYYYWLQNLDMDGGNAFHGPVRVEYSFNQTGTPNQPLVTSLNRIFPNPFNPIAFISYSLKEASPVQFKIYNNRGQLVRTIQNAPATPGNHRIEWNGLDNNGSACSTGLYLIRMEAGSQSFTQKVVLVK